MDAVSVKMRRKRRHNLIAGITEWCIQLGPLTQSIIMDSTCHMSTIRDPAVFICLCVIHGNNNSPNCCIENPSSIHNSHLSLQKATIIHQKVQVAPQMTKERNETKEDDHQYTRVQEKRKQGKTGEEKKGQGSQRGLKGRQENVSKSIQ